MAKTNPEKKNNKNQQVTYALYMIISSYFNKCECVSEFLETKLYLYYQELTAARQEPLENKIISFVEKELKDYLADFEVTNCKAIIKHVDETYQLIFETGLETVFVSIDKDSNYKLEVRCQE